MIALLLGLLLVSQAHPFGWGQALIVGPGALSYAEPGVLEAVAERRLKNNWGLTQDWRSYAALVAPADCALLGRAGWLVAGSDIISALVVDCENGNHAGTLERRGLLGDTNREEMTHRRAWLVLR